MPGKDSSRDGSSSGPKKEHNDNSKFSKYTAERRIGKVKNMAEFTSFSDDEGTREGFYKMDKDDSKDVVHREKGKSADKGAWTVAVTDIDHGNKKESTRDKVSYSDNSLDKVFSEFKELKFSKSGGAKRRRPKKASCSKKSSRKRSLSGSRKRSLSGSRKRSRSRSRKGSRK